MDNKKVIIFDFDGTFYTGEHKFDYVKEVVNNHRREFLPSLTDEEYKKIIKENPDFLNQVSGSDVVKYLYILKNKYRCKDINANAFWEWQNKEPYPLIIDPSQIVDQKYIQKLCKKYPVYIVSNSSPTHLDFYMKKIGIKQSWFKEIISNHFIETDQTKEHYYLDIAKREKVKFENVFVFGDSVVSDLLPARRLGMKDYFISNANEIPFIVDNALKDN